MADEPAVSAQTRELASRIYVDLVVRAADATGTKIQAAPDHLARLSFKLAAAFDVIEHELNEASRPKNQNFKVDAAAIESWTK